jgi:hypothetical protein
MLVLYQSSVRYIAAESALLGDGFAGLANSQQSRVHHFLDTLTKKEPDVDDAQNCLVELAKDTPAFSSDQRKIMGDAISTFMRQMSPISTHSTKQQHCPNIHNMWTDELWMAFVSKDISWDRKMEMAATFIIDVLGLRRPNDATVKNIVATLEQCHQREMTPNEAYTEVHAFKTKVSMKREMMPGPIPIMQYPNEVADFLKLFPKSYEADKPPVPSRIDIDVIRQRMRKDVMPTRNSNAKIRLNSKTLSDDPSSRRGAAASSSGEINMALLEFVLHGGRSTAPPPKAIADQQPPMLALTNEAHADAISPGGTGKTTNVTDILLEAKKVLASKKALAAQAKLESKAKKAKLTEEVDEDEADEDDDEEDSEENSDEEPAAAAAGVALKPAAAVKVVLKKTKKPAAAAAAVSVAKKPAAAAATTAVAASAASLKDSVYYNGGRIVYSEGRGCMRVFARVGDKREMRNTKYPDHPDGLSLKALWRKCQSFIDDDKRPR